MLCIPWMVENQPCAVVTLSPVSAASPTCTNTHPVSPPIYYTQMAPNAIAPRTAIPQQDRQASVRAYIDSTLTALVDQLSLVPTEAQPSIGIRCRATPANCTVNQNNGALEAVQTVEMHRTYSWPGVTAYESWKFSTLLCFCAWKCWPLMP
jgi:hypothetical protein